MGKASTTAVKTLSLARPVERLWISLGVEPRTTPRFSSF